ncbi:MAG TPA: hypothetical protein VIK59_10845 [Verrucomicrobiae bacterium]
MKKIEIEILSEKINCPVIQMPKRQFPGIVIQGDSLKILLSLSEEVISFADKKNEEDLKETAFELKGLLSGYMKIYEAAMQNNGKKLPYSK